MQSWVFLGLILGIAYLGHNRALMVAAIVVMVLKLIPQTEKLMMMINQKGMDWGVTLISIAILIPIATGKVGFRDLVSAFYTPIGYIAVACGILVALLSAKGVYLLNSSPEVTVTLVLGTIIGVVFLRGVAAGPIIAAGMTYVILNVFHLI